MCEARAARKLKAYYPTALKGVKPKDRTAYLLLLNRARVVAIAVLGEKSFHVGQPLLWHEGKPRQSGYGKMGIDDRMIQENS